MGKLGKSRPITQVFFKLFATKGENVPQIVTKRASPLLSCVWADCRQRPGHSNNEPFFASYKSGTMLRPSNKVWQKKARGGDKVARQRKVEGCCCHDKKTWRAFSYRRGGRKPDREKPIFAILTKMRNRIRAALFGSHFPDAKRLCFPPPATIFLKLIFLGFLPSDYSMHVSSGGVSILLNQQTFYLSAHPTAATKDALSEQRRLVGWP